MRNDSWRMVPSVASLALVLVIGVSTGCERNPAGPGVLATIEVVRSSETLVVGTSVQFTAVGKDAEGNRVGVAPVWSVTAGGGAVSQTGLFTAGTAPGTFPNTVTATVGSLSASASVTVQPGSPATIAVSPTSQSLTVGATQQFTAVVKDGFGNTLAVQPHWSVASGGGAISAGGLFTAGTTAGGFANTVVASIGSVAASASVTVTAGTLATITVQPSSVTLATGGVQQFTAAGADASGNAVAITPIWAVAAGGGTINATGRFTAGSVAGSFPNTVTATVGSVSGRASVTVSAGAAATITISPTTQSLAVGATQQFTAVVNDQAGNVLPLTPTWSVVAGGGTISSSGLFTAGTAAGSFPNTVRAAVGTVTATASITVTAGPLATVTVTPNLGSLTVGGTLQLAAAGRDGFGNPVTVSPSWSVVGGGGTISATGLFTAGTLAGQFANTVRACSTAACAAGSVAGFASMNIDPGPLATLSIAPNPVTVGTGASQPFTATGRDAGGNLIVSPGTLTWSVLPGHAGGAILPSGVYTAPAAVGPAFDSLRVAVGAIAGFARVNLAASGALASIVVTPNPASVVAGATRQFVATGYDGNGVPVPTPGLAWSLLPATGVGTINASSGLFTAGTSQGTFLNAVRATSGTITGYASVTVTAPPTAPSLGAATGFGVLAGSSVSCGTSGSIGGDLGVWPGAVTTGFPPCVVSGAIRAGDPAAQSGQTDLATAYQGLAALACNTQITADLGGTTLGEGVHCATGGVAVTGTVTLSGNANSVFVIRAGTSLTATGTVALTGGVQARNVFWVVGGSATVGNGSQWRGNLMALSAVTLGNTVALTGRALARNGAVSLGNGDTITLP